MNDRNETHKKLIFEQVGFTYVFKANNLIKPEELQKMQETIKRQLQEGCVIIDTRLTLESVQPHIEAITDNGRRMVKTWGLRGKSKGIK